jgi:ribosomal protein L32
MKYLSKCPRCKQYVLDHNNYGESAIYNSRHRLCNSCWENEYEEINSVGTNDIPATLAGYGPPNDINDEL